MDHGRTAPVRWLMALAVLALAGLACSSTPAPTEELPPASSIPEGKLDGIASSTDATRLADIPFYFAVPKSAISVTLNRPAYPYPTVWNPSLEVPEDGLRLIAVKQTTTSLADKQSARREMAERLARAGVLQDGDVALSFRPELAGTMAYPHIQMGSTHAGLVHTMDGVAYNVDSPLDSDYLGQFDSKHYAGNGTTDAGVAALHILRPRVMTEARRVQLRAWVAELYGNLARINGERAQVKFQSDYLKPIFVATGLTTRQTVTKLGQIIIEDDTATKLPMYCAELAWHLIALSSCTMDEIRQAPAEGADCVDEPFAPMPLVSDGTGPVGLAEGPLLALLQGPQADQPELIAAVFAEGNAAKLSAGHRAVAEQVAPLMAGLQQYYGARAGGAPAETIAAAAAGLSGAVQPNYSPTAFMVAAMTESRTVDYVTTIVFVSPVGYEKARRLARNPVP